MTLNEKIERAEAILREHLSPKSVLFCSFGKDSMVCLDLLLRLGIDLPLVFHRIPVFPEKEEFANRIIAEYGLRVHSEPPVAAALSLRDHPEIIFYHRLVGESTEVFPVGFEAPVEGQPFACGLELLTGPRRGAARPAEFPWDTMVHGQKAADRHFLFDDMTPLEHVFPLAPGLRAIYPILNFTDADVWAYIERFHVPFNEQRYDQAHGYQEFPDLRFNNDHYYGCVKCVLPDQPDPVACPKGGFVPNRHEGAPIVQIQPMPYMRGSRV